MCFVDLEKAFDRVPLWYSVGGSSTSMGSLWLFAKGCSVSVQPEQELGSHCRGSKSDLFPVHLQEGGSPVWEPQDFNSQLFADDVVLLASSGQDLQYVLLRRFAAECEVAGMRISTSKSEAMVLDWKRLRHLFHLLVGLGTPQSPPGRAGGSVWGEGSLGISAQTAAAHKLRPDMSFRHPYQAYFKVCLLPPAQHRKNDALFVPKRDAKKLVHAFQAGLL
ncbi:hypothetical protein L3Q82_022788 [Scortum barcoo]|uniref:Uncharacterized protein n=1 Tax=Scortum barcoo TaxID=214431 RepID=A0ACB8WXN0_9TELE|nr:hypothetical protein L3Q82_022788 [Scortum barcoo]